MKKLQKRPRTPLGSTTPPTPTRSRAPVPEHLSAFCATHLARGDVRFVLCHQTLSRPEVVETWEGRDLPEDASELAAKVWEAALEDAGVMGHGSAANYLVVTTGKDGSESSRRGFRVPLAATGSDGLVVHKPDAEGVIAQTMGHLATREAASQAMLVDGMQGLFSAAKAAVESIERARDQDRETFTAVTKSYKEALETFTEAAKTSQAGANAQIGILTTAFNSMAAKTIETIPVVEELASERHTRQLESDRLARSEARKDRFLAQAQQLVFPAFAAKVGAWLGGNAGAPPAAKAETSPGAPRDTSPRPSDVPPGATQQWTFFSTRVLRALEGFMAKLDAETFARMKDALSGDDERDRLFLEIAIALGQEAAEAQAAKGAEKSNGAPAPTKGAPAS